MLISAHIGNWEIAGQLLDRIKTSVNIVMLEAEHERIKAMLDEVMIKKNMNIIPVKEDYTHLIKISSALKNNELVAIHGDRFMPGSKKCWLILWANLPIFQPDLFIWQISLISQ